MPRITTQQVALGVGTSGALTDLSDYVLPDAEITYSWGRESDFDDTTPGQITLVLDNADGRFTPDNPASSLTTSITEGMDVCWQLGTRLVAGKIRTIEPEFPDGQAAWARVRLTVDDMLGQAARHEFEPLTTAILDSIAGTWGLPLDDPDGALAAAWHDYDQRFSSTDRTDTSPILAQFGVAGVEAGTTQARFTSAAGTATNCLVGLSTATAGGWPGFIQSWSGGCWLTVEQPAGYLELGAQTLEPVKLSVQGLDLMYYKVSTSSWVKIATLTHDPAFISWDRSGSSSVSIYLNGKLLVSDTISTPATAIAGFNIIVGGPTWGESSFLLQHLVMAPSVMTITASGEELVQQATAAQRLTLIASLLDDITLDTPPTGLSPALLGPQTTSGEAALDIINDIIRTEQGNIYQSTSGTLTSPTTKLIVRERDRPTTVDYTFDAELELQDAPGFIRDLANMVSRITVTGPTRQAIVTDTTLTSRVGAANATAQVALADARDLIAWGEDRLQRGANVKLRVVTATIDAMTTPTDRSSDLLALKPGDRIKLTGLPSTQLGFDEWEGWLLGAGEIHSVTEHTFALRLAPVLPEPARFNGSRFGDGGELTINTSINASTTTILVDTTGTQLTSTDTQVPFAIQVDDEEMLVTAATSADPQSVTVQRGHGGTTAASHSAGAAVVLPDLDNAGAIAENLHTRPHPGQSSTGFSVLANGTGNTFSLSSTGSSGLNGVGYWRATGSGTNSGTASLLLGSALDVKEGDNVVLAIWLRCSAAVSVQLRTRTYTGPGGTPGAGGNGSIAGYNLAANVWTYMETSYTVASGIGSIRPYLQLVAGVVASGRTFDFDQASMALGTTAADFTPVTDTDADWEGTAYQSASSRGGKPSTAVFAF